MPKSPVITRVLTLAQDYLGITTGDHRHRQLIDHYNRTVPLPQGYRASYQDPWCDIFVTHIFDRAGLSHLIGRECSVARHLAIFRRLGIWLGKKQPIAGDLILFDWNGDRHPDHIGLVEGRQGSRIHTIEGNSNDTCARRSYDLSDHRLFGFARPRYPAHPVAQPDQADPSLDTIAHRVIRGDFGNGADRVARLTAAGYNPDQVQTRVNQLLRSAS